VVALPWTSGSTSHSHALAAGVAAGLSGRGPAARHAGPNLSARFWFDAAFAVVYGICERMNGNWSRLEMITRVGALATWASLTLPAAAGLPPCGGMLRRSLVLMLALSARFREVAWWLARVRRR